MTIMGIGSVGTSDMMEIQKIFHENKPNRSSDNTKNPTVSSNSWSYLISKNTSGGYYYYRQGTDGSGGAEFTSWSYTGGSSGDPGGVAPRFMTNFYQSTGIRMDPQSGSAVDAGNEELAKMIKNDISAVKVRLSSGKDLNFVKSMQDKYIKFMPTENIAYESKLTVMLNQRLK